MKRNILVVLVTVIIISVMYFNAPEKSAEEQINVVTITPKEKNIFDYVNADGRIKEGNKRNIYVKRISQIGEVFVSEGENVEKGQALFEIEAISEEAFSGTEYIAEKNGIYEVFRSYGIELPDISSFSYISEEESVITSPIDGVITDLNISTGENVNPVKKLISVSDFSDLYIETLIPEAYSTRVKSGTEAKITAEAFGDNVYSGKIETIEPVAKYIPSITGEGKTYISAVIRPNSANKLFRPELTVNAKITVNMIKDALTVPYECIRQDDDGNEYVYCVDENDTIFKQEIKTGYELDNEVEIKKGITKESRVVFNPDESIKDNLKVMVSESDPTAVERK